MCSSDLRKLLLQEETGWEDDKGMLLSMTKSSCLRMDKDPTESLWVRIKERTGKSDITSVPAAGHLTGKNKQMNPLCTCNNSLVLAGPCLPGEFLNLDVCWRDSIAEASPIRKFHSNPGIC